MIKAIDDLAEPMWDEERFNKVVVRGDIPSDEAAQKICDYLAGDSGGGWHPTLEEVKKILISGYTVAEAPCDPYDGAKPLTGIPVWFIEEWHLSRELGEVIEDGE